MKVQIQLQKTEQEMLYRVLPSTLRGQVRELGVLQAKEWKSPVEEQSKATFQVYWHRRKYTKKKG